MVRVAYLVVILGSVLALATSIVPHYDAGYKLAFGVLVAGLLPYVVYGALSDILKGYALVIPGLLMLALDLYLSAHPYLFPDVPLPALLIDYLPLWLLVIVLPAGILAGRLIPPPSPAEPGEPSTGT